MKSLFLVGKLCVKIRLQTIFYTQNINIWSILFLYFWLKRFGQYRLRIIFITLNTNFREHWRLLRITGTQINYGFACFESKRSGSNSSLQSCSRRSSIGQNSLFSWQTSRRPHIRPYRTLASQTVFSRRRIFGPRGCCALPRSFWRRCCCSHLLRA